MNVASLELCQELYKLSGWFMDEWDELLYPDIPAYDLGYLLRKLPSTMAKGIFYRQGEWRTEFVDMNNNHKLYNTTADTPENAAAKLAIELFKQGILKREGEE